MTLQEEIYAQGFIDKCADAVGASPEALVKECAEAGLIKEGFTAIELAIALAGILGLGYGGKKLYDYATKPKEPPVSPVRRVLGQLGQKATGAVEGIKGLFTGAKEGEAMESVAQGFIKRCAELGVNPEELVKRAVLTPLTPEELKLRQEADLAEDLRAEEKYRLGPLKTLLLGTGIGAVGGAGVGARAGANVPGSAVLGAGAGATIASLIVLLKKLLSKGGEKEGEAMESLARGFAEKCAELGVDPEELAKWAQGRAYNPSVAAATKAKARQVGPGRLAATGVGGALIADKLKPSPKAGPAGGTMMAPAGAGKGRAFDPELASKTKTKALGAGAGSTLTSLGGGGLIGSLAQRLRSGLTSAP